MRSIDTIIIHCSATPEGRDVSTETIKQWHLNRGWSDIGYHFIIELNGTVNIGRPIERSGAHARGYNSTSIGICYVGGCDKDMKPKDTMTEEQFNACMALIIDLQSSYPTIDKVIGHNDVSNKACPSFNVREKFDL